MSAPATPTRALVMTPPGRSGELPGKPGRPSQPVEENADDNTDYEDQKKRHDWVGGAHGSDPPLGVEARYRTSTIWSQEQRFVGLPTMQGPRAMRIEAIPRLAAVIRIYSKTNCEILLIQINDDHPFKSQLELLPFWE